MEKQVDERWEPMEVPIQRTEGSWSVPIVRTAPANRSATVRRFGRTGRNSRRFGRRKVR